NRLESGFLLPPAPFDAKVLPMSSLIPEKPLFVSPSLAATIGLEEACMLSVLNEVATYRPSQHSGGRSWFEVDEALVNKLMPFWTDYASLRISKHLTDKGIILLASPPYTPGRNLTVAFADANTD